MRIIGTKELEKEVMEALKERGFSKREIREMPVREAFSEYCQWQGLLGWGYHLDRVHHILEEKICN